MKSMVYRGMTAVLAMALLLCLFPATTIMAGYTTWSEWSTVKPNTTQVEQKTQYRYNTRSTTTSTTTKSMAGWTYISTVPSTGGWSAWSDSQAYAVNTDALTRQVESRSVVSYYTYRYSHWCRWINSYPIQYDGCNTYHEIYLNTKLPYIGTYSIGGAKYNSDGYVSRCANGCYSWSNETAIPNYKTQWRYIDTQYVHSFEKISATSDWSDLKPSTYYQLSTRTLYRGRNYVADAVSVAGVSLDISELTIPKGATGKLSAIVSPENATNKSVVWSSSNPSVAVVNSNGTITGVEAGSAIIYATSLDGSKSAGCRVTVSSITETGGLHMNRSQMRVAVGSKPTSLKAISTATNQALSNVRWSSSNKRVATVNSKGVVVDKGQKGTVTITAKTPDGQLRAQCKITYHGVAVKSLSAKKSISLSKGKKVRVNIYLNPTNATVPWVTLISSNTKIAKVSKNEITGVKKGKCTITAKADNGKKVKISVTVK